MSIINWGGGLAAAGSAISSFAHDAGVAEQKSELERQQAILNDQLATTRETTLAGVQGEESRKTAVVSAEAGGKEARITQEDANKLPMTAAQSAADTLGRDTLNETKSYHQGELNKPIPSGYNGALIKDPTAPGGWRQVGASSFTPEMGALMGALTERGVSVPAGFRSQKQQTALYQSLLDRNPDKTPDQIADGIKAGQIQFGAEKKETLTAAGIAGKVRVAEKEIFEFAPNIRAAAAKVDRGNFVPINQLMQLADKNISDPNLKSLKIQINGMLNAYDVLAGRGGTDAEKRAEAHSLLTTADGPEALEAGLKAFEIEARAAHRAAKAAMRLDNDDDTPPTEAPPSAKPVVPNWVKPGDQYSASRGKARDQNGNEYGPPQ